MNYVVNELKSFLGMLSLILLNSTKNYNDGQTEAGVVKMLQSLLEM